MGIVTANEAGNPPIVAAAAEAEEGTQDASSADITANEVGSQPIVAAAAAAAAEGARDTSSAGETSTALVAGEDKVPPSVAGQDNSSALMAASYPTISSSSSSSSSENTALKDIKRRSQLVNTILDRHDGNDAELGVNTRAVAAAPAMRMETVNIDGLKDVKRRSQIINNLLDTSDANADAATDAEEAANRVAISTPTDDADVTLSTAQISNTPGAWAIGQNVNRSTTTPGANNNYEAERATTSDVSNNSLAAPPSLLSTSNYSINTDERSDPDENDEVMVQATLVEDEQAQNDAYFRGTSTHSSSHLSIQERSDLELGHQSADVTRMAIVEAKEASLFQIVQQNRGAVSGFLCLLILGVLALSVGIGCGTGNCGSRDSSGTSSSKNEESQSLTATDIPSSASPTPFFLESLPIYTEMEIIRALNMEQNQAGAITSPQLEAYRWLQQDPHYLKYTPARLLQRFALAAFYYSTSMRGNVFSTESSVWINAGGWLDYDYDDGIKGGGLGECGWFLVKENWDPDPGNGCNGDMEVQYLVLYENGLQGTIPREIELLSSLRVLELDNNKVRGTIPSEISQLTGLLALSLFSNAGVYGRIPTEISSMTTLNSLHLGELSLTGTIPTGLGELTALRFLGLEVNPFSGTLPSELGLLTNLEDMVLYMNQLTSTIPSSFGNLVNLIFCDLSRNRLNGSTYFGWTADNSIEYLSLFENHFIGTIGSEIGLLNAKTTEFLHYGGNPDLTGPIPTEIGVLTNLLEFTGWGTDLTETLPTELLLLPDLYMLELESSSVSGVIPEELCGMPELLFDCSDVLCGCDCGCSDFFSPMNSTSTVDGNRTFLIIIEETGAAFGDM